ncbi:hypothetical protein AGDE_13718 [Angomonas deanei]|uniref:Conserved oligomeric Golgi complex subunit 2 n=1 Tax=Angomonas deanei TaxID=59799 RepID=A0A7G2C1W7_9TRYP|nr:hypothetical protein AGDE_13718 [Angomonas deanei]CAD2213221.1 COG (conserved oligomeric Golgi) complex component, COG2/Domain of unknown function (DUF3510), putative [Angomonas deanei]|eukprot:EPY21896.1 hypothetical protein AGDE_13718 [Angomonas deanei]
MADVEQPELQTDVVTVPTISGDELRLIQMCFSEHEFGVLTEAGEEALAGAISTSFDPLSFVREKNESGVSLATLRGDLDFFASHINSKITNRIQTEMQDALSSVSTRLIAVQDELQLMEQPLTSSIRKVDAAHKKIDDKLKSVSLKVQHASEEELEVLFDKQLLQGTLYYDQFCTCALEFRPFVEEVTTADMDGSITLILSALEKVEAILTLAVQLRQIAEVTLPKLGHREKHYNELRAWSKAATEAVLYSLDTLFSAIAVWYIQRRDKKDPVATKSLDALIQLREMYSLLDCNTEFCVMFREKVLRQLFDKIVSWKDVTQIKQSTENSIALLRKVEYLLSTDVIPLLKVLRRFFPDQSPASQILWPAVFEMLTKKFITLYDYAMADTFHQKYVAAYRLLALCENCCDTLEELVQLRTSADVGLWNHKWNTDAYVALRVGELEGALSALQNTQLTPNEPGNTAKYNFPIFDVLESGLLRLFSQEVYLQACAMRFIKTGIALVSRVVREMCHRLEEVLKADGQNSDNGVPLGLQFVGDLQKFVTFLQTDFSRQVHMVVGESTTAFLRVHNGNGEETSVLIHLISWLSETFQKDFMDHTLQMILAGVRRNTDAALQHIKTIRSTLSGKKNTLPTQPSWFLNSVVAPIRVFVTNCQASAVDPAVLSPLVYKLVEGVLEHFFSVAKETLLTAKLTEARWEKLRKQKDPSTTDMTADGVSPTTAIAPGTLQRVQAEAATDIDKMFIQLYLDVRELTRQLRELGVVPDSLFGSSCLLELQSLVRRGEWLLGADIPEPPELVAEAV